MSLNRFFKPLPKNDADAPPKIKWTQKVKASRCSSTIKEVERSARPGAFLIHRTLGKVQLVGKSEAEPGKLEVDISEKSGDLSSEVVTRRDIVEASDCEPTATPKQGAPLYLNDAIIIETEWRREMQVWCGIQNEYDDMIRGFFGDVPCNVAPSDSGRGRKRGRKHSAAPDGAAPPLNKGGRPKGSKDKVPGGRKRRSDAKASAARWAYAGAKGVA